eukprot:g16762.t1
MHGKNALNEKLTPHCASEIKALRECREENKYAKFFNACDKPYRDLQLCLDEDFQMKHQARRAARKAEIEELRKKKAARQARQTEKQAAAETSSAEPCLNPVILRRQFTQPHGVASTSGSFCSNRRQDGTVMLCSFKR